MPNPAAINASQTQPIEKSAPLARNPSPRTNPSAANVSEDGVRWLFNVRPAAKYSIAATIMSGAVVPTPISCSPPHANKPYMKTSHQAISAVYVSEPLVDCGGA